jgi:deaminated glutathione amidase
MIEEEIAHRVTGDAELGKDDERVSLSVRPIEEREGVIDVALEVGDPHDGDRDADASKSAHARKLARSAAARAAVEARSGVCYVGAMFLAACVQMRSVADVEVNLASAEKLIRRAAAHGAKLVATPENTSFLGPQFHKVELAEDLDGPIAARFGALAKELSIHLLIGSIAEKRIDFQRNVDAKHCFNTSMLYAPSGERIAVYRKIHLFDVDVPGGVTIRESDSIAAGNEVVLAPTELGSLGMSICYDLRFAELYRALVDRGAQIITVPSAFTLATGKDHWHTLLRARAIETQCFVLAPAQWGAHDAEGKRVSYGHSLIIDPWGTILAEAGDGEGICLAEIDLARVAQVRKAIPVADHRRL